MRLLNNPSIIWDKASSYSPDQIVESKFFSSVLSLLHSKLYQLGHDSLIFIFSNADPDQQPSSIDFPTQKKKILVYISNELSKEDILDRLASRYFAIFKTYLSRPSRHNNVFHLWPGTLNHNSLSDNPSSHCAHRGLDIFFSGALNNHRVSLYRVLMSSSVPLLGTLSPNLYRRFAFLFSKAFAPAPWLKNYHSRISFNQSFLSGLSSHVYYAHLLNAKISICPPGYDSLETFRHLESLQAGAVVISLALPDFAGYSRSPSLQINSWHELPFVIADLLSSPSLIRRLSLQSSQYWISVFSETSTVNYMLSSLQSLVCH
jgi:hypothetical protein